MILLQFSNPATSKIAWSTRLLAFLPLYMLKKSGTYDTHANFKFWHLTNDPEHETVAFLQLAMLKKSGTYDTPAIFRIPASQRRLEKGPEHETIGIFSHFQWQKRPGSRDGWHFLSGVRKKHVKIRQKESADSHFAPPREKTRTKRTLGQRLYREKEQNIRYSCKF